MTNPIKLNVNVHINLNFENGAIEMKWNEMIWYEMKWWNEMIWYEMKWWNEMMKWNDNFIHILKIEVLLSWGEILHIFYCR